MTRSSVRPEPVPRTAFGRTCLLAASLLACGPSSGSSASSDGGGSGETDAGTSAGSSGTAGTAGAGECPVPFGDDPSPDAASEIVVRNDTDTVQYLLPIFLGCDSELVSLAVDGFGPDRPFSNRPPAACRNDAGEVVPEAFCSVGCSDGTYPGAALAPGAELSIPWDGTVWVWTDLVGPECTYETLCGPLGAGEPGGVWCQIRRAVVPGTPITVRAEVTTACPTAETVPEACACASGTCPIWVYDLDAPSAEQTISVDGVAGTDVEILIEP